MEIDALEQNNRDQAAAMTPSEKLGEALEMMEFGFDLKRAALRLRHPGESTDQIEARLTRWLASEE